MINYFFMLVFSILLVSCQSSICYEREQEIYRLDSEMLVLHEKLAEKEDALKETRKALRAARKAEVLAKSQAETSVQHSGEVLQHNGAVIQAHKAVTDKVTREQLFDAVAAELGKDFKEKLETLASYVTQDANIQGEIPKHIKVILDEFAMEDIK